MYIKLGKKGFQLTIEVIVVLIVLLALLVFLIVFLSGQGGKVTSLFDITVNEAVGQTKNATM